MCPNWPVVSICFFRGDWDVKRRIVFSPWVGSFCREGNRLWECNESGKEKRYTIPVFDIAYTVDRNTEVEIRIAFWWAPDFELLFSSSNFSVEEKTSKSLYRLFSLTLLFFCPVSEGLYSRISVSRSRGHAKRRVSRQQKQRETGFLWWLE